MNKIVEKLKASGSLRTLTDSSTSQRYIKIANKQYINLSSNDYMSLSDINLQSQFFETIDLTKEFVMSNPSSRLITGNSLHYNNLETYIAQLYGKEQAIVLSSGFMLNSGVLPAMTVTDDYIIADKLVHASLIDGMRLCDCQFARFKHNDTKHLRKLLETANCKGQIYVVLESIYSMDGDIAPLKEIVELKKEFGFKIYLDEAHAFGVRGEKGLGVAEELDLMAEIDYTVVTLGKASVSQGAFIVCDNDTHTTLVNKMRTLIFSTALPPLSLMWSRFIIEHITTLGQKRKQFYELCEKVCNGIAKITNAYISVSHIIPVIVGDNNMTLKLAEDLREAGFWVTAIRPPTVPVGSSRLRISLCASLNDEDVEKLLDILKNKL